MHRTRQHGHGDAPGAIRQAHAYELLSVVVFAGRRRRTYGRFVELADVRAGDRVLDIGCGPGYLTSLAAEAGGSAVGVDVSEPMVEEARRLRGSGNCTFEIGRAEALPFEDGSFDVIVSALAVHHIPEEHRATAYTEMRRVLKPGGRALIADFRPPRNRAARHLVRALTGGEAMSRNPFERIAPMMTEAGLHVTSTHEVGAFFHCVRAEKA
ncbi:class I SAM-dependent methyltransferase [Saccharothrix variisporea]|uniref:Methyltransferase family protein n=1 Tax=Saccharothrix variisporea TaxID=543527 RepID=A0A495WZ61_9PSEU|nr:methyltransferase domain-containing protein [Saccharothrix variisporea]RKT66927.1 methyltransferase family protein [Saccharothrix variisporea]